MTPGTVAASVAGLLTLLVAVVTVAALWPEPRHGRRRATRVEKPRGIALSVEDHTEDLTPYQCPYCGRNAGHNSDCFGQRQMRRADEIQIPREGETK